MTRPEVTPLELGTFRFPDPELAHRQGVVMGYAIRHRGGILLFDTRLGFGNEELDQRYHPAARRIEDALADAGISVADVTAVANCHLHADHAGQNSSFPDVPIYVQASEWEIAHTTDRRSSSGSTFPRRDMSGSAAIASCSTASGSATTPAHTPGHRSLAVETDRGLVVLAGQAVYTVDEWVGTPDELEGRTSAPDREGYDRSTERLRALDPDLVHFGHDRRAWRRAEG